MSERPRPGSPAWFDEVEASYKAIGDRALERMGLKPTPEPVAKPKPALTVVVSNIGRPSIEAVRVAAQRQLDTQVEREREQAILIAGITDEELRCQAFTAYRKAAEKRAYAERKMRKAWSKIGVELT